MIAEKEAHELTGQHLAANPVTLKKCGFYLNQIVLWGLSFWSKPMSSSTVLSKDQRNPTGEAPSFLAKDDDSVGDLSWHEMRVQYDLWRLRGCSLQTRLNLLAVRYQEQSIGTKSFFVPFQGNENG